MSRQLLPLAPLLALGIIEPLLGAQPLIRLYRASLKQSALNYLVDFKRLL